MLAGKGKKSMSTTLISPDPGSSNAGNKLSHNNSFTKFFLGLAAFALGQVLQNGHQTFTVPAIIWLTIALICAGASVISQRHSLPNVSQKLLWFVLLTGLVVQIYQLTTSMPGHSIPPANFPKLQQFQIFILVGGICALLSLSPGNRIPRRMRSSLTGAAFVAVLAAGVWVIRASPNPFIDVYVFHQSSSEALLQGRNPYELTTPNIYGDTKFYGAAFVKDGQLTIGNPYPPLSIYLSFLGYALARDIRYSHLIAILVAGLLMAVMRPDQEALLATYLFLFTPRLYFVLEQSWTEPLVLCLLIAVVWSALHRPGLKFILLGLLIASKQYMLFIFPLIFKLFPPGTPRQKTVRSCAWVVGTAFTVTAPLAFWNFPAFLWNVGLFQWYQVFRMDSLSYAALYARMFGQTPSQFIPFIVLGAALFIVWRYGEHSPAGFAAGLAFCLGLFIAFSKQAFCNYYFLVVGTLCCAFAAFPRLDNQATFEGRRLHWSNK
jgi:hypothetical protein